MSHPGAQGAAQTVQSEAEHGPGEIVEGVVEQLKDAAPQEKLEQLDRIGQSERGQNKRAQAQLRFPGGSGKQRADREEHQDIAEDHATT